MSRWYKFRLDCILARVPGARAALQLQASGVDALGEVFSTKRKRQCLPPITMTWSYIGRPFTADELATGDNLDEIRARGVGEDAHDRQLRELFGLAPKAQSQQELQQDSSDTRCEHEVDATGTFCLKCRRPLQ